MITVYEFSIGARSHRCRGMWDSTRAGNRSKVHPVKVSFVVVIVLYKFYDWSSTTHGAELVSLGTEGCSAGTKAVADKMEIGFRVKILPFFVPLWHAVYEVSICCQPVSVPKDAEWEIRTR